MTKELLCWSFTRQSSIEDMIYNSIFGDYGYYRINYHNTKFNVSKRIIDALSYAKGNYCYLLRCTEDIEDYKTYISCRKIKVLFGVNTTNILKQFVRECALLEDNVKEFPLFVRYWLETGDDDFLQRAKDSISTMFVGTVVRYALSINDQNATQCAWHATECDRNRRNHLLESMVLEVMQEKGFDLERLGE